MPTDSTLITKLFCYREMVADMLTARYEFSIAKMLSTLDLNVKNKSINPNAVSGNGGAVLNYLDLITRYLFITRSEENKIEYCKSLNVFTHLGELKKWVAGIDDSLRISGALISLYLKV